MPRLARVVLASLASGLVWAGVALLLAALLDSSPAAILMGGVMAAPLIGVAAGFASARFPRRRITRAVFSLVSLYAAAALFGAGVGAWDLYAERGSGEGWQRIPSAVVLETMAAMVWGLTFSGAVILLWPLAYANHALVARLWTSGGLAWDPPHPLRRAPPGRGGRRDGSPS